MMECSSGTTSDEEQLEVEDNMPPPLVGEDEEDGDAHDNKAFGFLLCH
jgi:hypothetical protein